MKPCALYLRSYNISNFPVAAIFPKMAAIFDLFKPRDSDFKLSGLRSEMLLVFLNLA